MRAKSFNPKLRQVINKCIARYCQPLKIRAHVDEWSKDNITIYFAGHKYAGLEINYEQQTGIIEFIEYQAGEHENELHVFGEYKTFQAAFRRFIKGKCKPVKIWI